MFNICSVYLCLLVYSLYSCIWLPLCVKVMLTIIHSSEVWRARPKSRSIAWSRFLHVLHLSLHTSTPVSVSSVMSSPHSTISFLLSCSAGDRCMMSLSPWQVGACSWQNKTYYTSTRPSVTPPLFISLPCESLVWLFKRPQCRFGARSQSVFAPSL